MESLVGYASDDDIDDRSTSIKIVQDHSKERLGMDNYDNILMDMSEESNNSPSQSRDHQATSRRDEQSRQKEFSTNDNGIRKSTFREDSSEKKRRYSPRHDRRSLSREKKRDRRSQSKERRKEGRSQSNDKKRYRRSESREKRGERSAESKEKKRDVRSESREKRIGDMKRGRSPSKSDKRTERSNSRDKVQSTDDRRNNRGKQKSQRDDRHHRDKRRSNSSERREPKDRKRRKDRSRSRSPTQSGSSPVDQKRGRRSPERWRRDRSSTLSSRSQYEKKPSKLSILERLGIALPSVNDLQGAVTPQQLVQRSMALQVQQVKSTTGIELPSYYNPAAMNPARYAEQIQKRRLLWGNKDKNEAVCSKTAEAVPEPPAAPVGANNWQGTTFRSDQDGKMTAKFKRLMGIKEKEAVETTSASIKPTEGNEILKKQEELFNSMEMQYEVARVATHTHRGLGLGFGTFQYPR